jgi:hypothetical protein
LYEYNDRFQGLGRIKDFKLKLYIDESVKPVAQNVRIPYKMKKKVEIKIDELEKHDIIEKVEGPTPWVSNLVPIPKQKKSYIEGKISYAKNRGGFAADEWICNIFKIRSKTIFSSERTR